MHRLPPQRLFSITLIVMTVLMIWLWREPVISTLGWFGDPEAIRTSLQVYNRWGPAIISLLILVQLFIAFIPGHALVVTSGYIYGAPLTILFVSITGIAGSQLAFSLARKYGRPLIYRFASLGAIDKWNKIAGEREGLFYLFMFVLPFVPSDMMCYVAGLGRISPKRFFIANLIGRLWSTTETALLGAYGLQPPLWLWVLFFISLAGLYAGWRIYDKTSRPPGGKT